MRKLLIAILLILSQLFFLRDYLPFVSNTILVQGQRCTCPHARVLNGKRALMKMFPDSLNSEHVDFSEIYFENEISTHSDPMGVGKYIIKGKIVGVSAISEGDKRVFPVFQIKDFQSATSYIVIQWIFYFVLIIEVLLMIRFCSRHIKSKSKQI